MSKKIYLMLIISIIFLSFLNISYAEEINYSEKRELNNSNMKLINGTYYFLPNESNEIITIKHNDKLHTELPTISMWAKPSCNCRHYYGKWYKNTFIDYCPHCHKYNVLMKNPKGVYEKEYTCRICNADYCAVCGKEKYNWSKYYLIQV